MQDLEAFSIVVAERGHKQHPLSQPPLQWRLKTRKMLKTLSAASDWLQMSTFGTCGQRPVRHVQWRIHCHHIKCELLGCMSCWWQEVILLIISITSTSAWCHNIIYELNNQGCFSRGCVFYTFIIGYFCIAVNCGYFFFSIREVCRKSADCSLRALWTRWARLWTSPSKHRLPVNTSANSTRLYGFSQELGLDLLGTVKTWWITASIVHVLPTDPQNNERWLSA